MKRKSTRIATLLMVGAMAWSMTACGGASSSTSASSASTLATDDEVYTISWAHSSSTNDRLALATEKMAAELKEASNRCV